MRQCRRARIPVTPVRAMHPSRTLTRSRDDARRMACVCASALAEARTLAAAGRFGAIFDRSLARAGDALDAIDEVLVGLDPRREHESFVRAAQLHRELEAIQSRIPRECRWTGRRGADRAAQAAGIVPPETATGAGRPY